MRKIFGNILLILSVLLILTILNIFHNNSKNNLLNAYDASYENCYPPYIYGPNLVNAMQSNSGPGCPQLVPPAGAHNDYSVWQGYAPLPYATPVISSNTAEACIPTTKFGTGYLRIIWTGNDLGSDQYIYLTSNLFENQTSGNWSNYDYFRFNIFYNFCANNFSYPATIYQTASIYDNNGITRTAGPVMVPPQSGGNWSIYYSASLNYLRNQYDTVNGVYLNINNIAGFKINAIDTDYTQNWLYSLTSGTHPQDSKHILIYYDYLTLGASDAMPEYGSPSGVTVTTAGTGLGIQGALITWAYPPNPEPTPGIPITGYHIYRSLNSPAGGHPYVSVGIVDSYTVNYLTDTSCVGGNRYCYKVLILNNGPDASSPTKNAINATYHESLLDDVPEYCGWVNARPTNTNTPTPTWTEGYSTTPPTATATPTLTPQPTQVGIEQAHVYPNPYNPNKGSGFFYVDNVVDQTKIYIYAMDGSLVNDGVFNSTQGRFKWDGLNKNGSRVVSGLYYLVLEDPSGKTRVLRIIVCYDCDPVYKP
ncbi:MAG: T9SS type A sorting domain-containing protein [Candidatus Goldbacteria bacterium]|nr:T9SS type A sorting domain-containing protein [Candidatus Goldiibacteriota bacterium]